MRGKDILSRARGEHRRWRMVPHWDAKACSREDGDERYMGMFIVLALSPVFCEQSDSGMCLG